MQIIFSLILTLMIFVIPTAFADEIINIYTDKLTYFPNEEILISGNTTVSDIFMNVLPIYLVYPDGTNQYLALYVDPETKEFEYTIDYLSPKNVYGQYILNATLNDISNTISFNLIKYPLTFQIDKKDYYINEDIFTNGTITDIDWSKDITVYYDINHSDSTIITSTNGGAANVDGTFDFTISTSGWDFDDYITVEVTIQDFTVSTSFNYYNTPNIENDKLYELITDNTNMIDSHFIEINNNSGILNIHNETITNNTIQIDQQHYTMESYNSTLIIQSQQILDLQIDNQALQDELQSLRGIFTILNNTISDEFPIELDGVTIREVTQRIEQLDGDIILLNSQIEGDLVRLTDAILSGNEIRITTLTKAIGSHYTWIFLIENQLDIMHFNIDRYNLLPEE